MLSVFFISFKFKRFASLDEIAFDVAKEYIEKLEKDSGNQPLPFLFYIINISKYKLLL